ncbi:Rab-like protein 3 [Toxocara canis]|uniref:Rab-like protein 3 n=2 Tax=Toxocara canis TaxID=6265 RepID=A0A0B2VKK1_TOXCA|nr:Rab-like protein 3 [Toxocara canis]
MRTCYDILGCTPSASTSELKSAYFQSLRANHPDKGGLDASAISLIANAWKILSCGGEYILDRSDLDRIVESALFECSSCSLCLELLAMSGGQSAVSSLKVVVLGSSGVGKSSFVNAVCNRSDVFPSSTVGCAVSVIAHQYRAGSAEEETELIELWDIGGSTMHQSNKVVWSQIGCAVSVIAHQYRAGSAEEETELIELWDIGGSTMHQKASTVFLEGAVGAILVHDVSNSKSEASLAQWVSLLRGDNAGTLTSVPSISNLRPLLADIESTPIPTLVVGCKLDLAPERAKQAGYDRINVDCRKAMAPGSTNRIILSKFFDSVVERRKAPMASERRRRLL